MPNGDSDTPSALEQLYEDALDLYERARAEVIIPRNDGGRQHYAPVRYNQQIERAYRDGELVPAIARIICRRTAGFGHLEDANRPDLMLETLVLDRGKPYHRPFTVKTVQIAQQRMAEYDQRNSTRES